jgi:RNA polymerase sigma-70 factor, ECF subfamily
MPTIDELVSHQKSFKKFLTDTENLRPDLYRYCRHLSANPWDAEDLVQETLLRCYAKLGCVYFEIADWRAYLFRTATNIFLNQQRRAGVVEAASTPEARTDESAAPILPTELREALLVLLQHLSPQERTALVLKDVFDLRLEEVATYLETTVGATKAALSRARTKVAQSPKAEGPAPRETSLNLDVLNQWVSAFNAHDVDKLASLLREDATAEVVGLVQEFGRENIRKGSLPHTLAPDTFATMVVYLGEPIILLGTRRDNSEQFSRVYTIMRFKTAGTEIVDMKYYFFTQDLVKEVAEAMGQPGKPCGYYFFD